MALSTTNLALLLCMTACAYAHHLEDYNDFQKLMQILGKPRMLDRKKYTNQILKVGGIIKAFRFENCGESTDPMQIKSISLSPDPVTIPGDVNISFNALTMVSLKAPITMELTVKKKILFWIEIPCVDDIGSCSYHDVCSLLSTIKCPKEFHKAKIPCECPYKSGTYILPRTQLTILPIGLPGWLNDGEYQVTAKLSSNGQPIGCLYVELSLTAGNQ